jgi:hypothetical protein
MKNLKLILLLAVASVIMALAACNKEEQGGTTPTTKPEPKAPAKEGDAGSMPLETPNVAQPPAGGGGTPPGG